MSKEPVQKLVHLKVLVDEDQEGKDACDEFDLDELRPRTRRDCLPGGKNAQRPCPWYGCKYHLGLKVNEETGSISVRNIDEMVHTCDLDVAEIGGIPGSGKGTGITLEEAGEIMDLTRERMRQIEFRGMVELKPILIAHGLEPEHWRRRLNELQKKRATGGSDKGTQEDQEKTLDSDDDED